MSEHWELIEFPAGILTGLLKRYQSTEPVLYARAHAYLKELSEKGNKTQEPVSKPLGDKLFELRPHTDEIQLRLIYYFSPTEYRIIVFVNCIVKKTEVVPGSAKKLAKSRRKEREGQRGKKKKVATHKGKSNG